MWWTRDTFLKEISNPNCCYVYSKSEYVIFKLKEMGKIHDKDIMEIYDQFRKLDPSNCGKITLPHLLEGMSWQNENTIQKINIHANVHGAYFLVIGLLGEKICTEISSIRRSGGCHHCEYQKHYFALYQCIFFIIF